MKLARGERPSTTPRLTRRQGHVCSKFKFDLTVTTERATLQFILAPYN